MARLGRVTPCRRPAVEINEHVPSCDTVHLRVVLGAVAQTLPLRAEQRQMKIALELS